MPKGRSLINSVLKSCYVCKRINSQPFRYPSRTEFIRDKVNFVTPFKYTGIDLTGHLYVKLGTDVVKMYIIIYTCLNVRAIHLDLLPNMTTEAILMSFVRFSNVHGLASIIYSDNANYFKKALTMLKNSYNDDSFNEHLIKNNIEHHTIPLYASWAGSAWERMIRTVKMCLHKSIGRSRMSYFPLITLFSDIKEAINNRPLTYQNGDNNDVLAITPNDFVKVKNDPNLFLSPDLEVPSISRNDCIDTLRAREKNFEKFKEKWFEEYLLSLREHERNIYEDSWVNRITVGDVVLIGSDLEIKPFWHLGRIIQTFPGVDGKIRSAKVLRHNRTEGIYPICKLYPMELSLCEMKKGPSENVNVSCPTDQRPQRLAAQKCKQSLKRLYN